MKNWIYSFCPLSLIRNLFFNLIKPMNTKLHDLIRELASRSTCVTAMNLATSLANSPLEGKLLDLANTPTDLDRMARSIDILHNKIGLPAASVETSLRNLITARSFYGQYCELAAYEWFERHQVRYQTQIPLSGQDVLNPKGCIIDGEFRAIDGYFDIKAMGFQAYLASVFRDKLQQSLTGFIVTVEGSMDVAIRDIEVFALGKVPGFASALSNGGVETIAQLNWTIKAQLPRSVVTTISSINPYRSAEQNCYYPFKTAGQFSRKKPFILIFSYSAKFNPWLAQNFGNSTDITFRSLARRVFMRLTSDSISANHFDNKVMSNISIGDAAKLISGLLFLNLDNDDAWMFLNPRATNLMSFDRVEQMF